MRCLWTGGSTIGRAYKASRVDNNTGAFMAAFACGCRSSPIQINVEALSRRVRANHCERRCYRTWTYKVSYSG